MIESITLSLLYLVAFFVIGLAAFCCGALVSPWLEHNQPDAPDRPADWLHGLLLRYGLGLGMLSACGAWLGLAGWLRFPAVAAAALTLALSGAAVFIHRGEAAAFPGHMRELRADARRFWRSLGCSEKIAAGALGVFAALLVVNILIGMMAPDMCQDAAMWYHLPVPGQWAITGRTEVFPWVFWSSLPLALESLYAQLLLFGDEVLCTLLAAQITLALLAGIAVEALRRSDGRAALMAVATLGAGVAIINGLAPISVKNDRFASLSLFLGFTLALDVLSALRNSAKAQKIWQRMAVAGFFLGMAAAAKPLAIGFCLPMTVIFFFATGWSSQRPRSAAQAADAHHSFSIAVLISRFDLAFALRIGAALAAGACAAYAPWAIRGIRASGDPYFPLGAALFPIRSEYLPAYAIVRQTNPLYEFSLSGLSHALGGDLIEKIYRGMASGDFMLLLFIGATVAALASRDPLRRIQGLTLASFAPVYIAMHGGIEVNRYFAIGYGAAAGAFGGMFGGISARLGPKGRAALLGALLLLCGGSYVKRQYHFAHFDVIQWRYRPIVTQAERRALAERAQLAEYDIFDAARPLIESDAGVLLPDCWQPFYLRRRCVWGDQAFHLDQPNALPWMRKGPQAQEETRRLIKEKDLRYVLLMDRKNAGLFQRLAESGFLVSIALPREAAGAPPSWALYRVASDGRNIK